MSTILEVERLALDLPETDRALLVARLLQSFPPVLDVQLDRQIEGRRKNR